MSDWLSEFGEGLLKKSVRIYIMRKTLLSLQDYPYGQPVHGPSTSWVLFLCIDLVLWRARNFKMAMGFTIPALLRIKKCLTRKWEHNHLIFSSNSFSCWFYSFRNSGCFDIINWLEDSLSLCLHINYIRVCMLLKHCNLCKLMIDKTKTLNIECKLQNLVT